MQGGKVPFNMRMDASLKARLEEYCRETGQSMSVAVSRCLAKALDEYSEKARGGVREHF